MNVGKIEELVANRYFRWTSYAVAFAIGFFVVGPIFSANAQTIQQSVSRQGYVSIGGNSDSWCAALSDGSVARADGGFTGTVVMSAGGWKRCAVSNTQTCALDLSGYLGCAVGGVSDNTNSYVSIASGVNGSYWGLDVAVITLIRSDGTAWFADSTGIHSAPFSLYPPWGWIIPSVSGVARGGTYVSWSDASNPATGYSSVVGMYVTTDGRGQISDGAASGSGIVDYRKGGANYMVLYGDGHVSNSYGPYDSYFSGSYVEIGVVPRDWENNATIVSGAMAVRNDGMIDCKASSDISAYLCDNLPSYPVRSLAVGSLSYLYVRESDNSVWRGTNSGGGGLRQVALSTGGQIVVNPPTGGGGGESCQDGIKNQDETDVDVGGICGGYQAFAGPNGSVCKNQEYVDPNAGAYEPMAGYFSGSWDAYQDDANSYVKIQSTGSGLDVLESFGLDMSGSYLNVDTFKSLTAGTGSEFVMNKLASYTGRNQMFLRSVRDGNVRPVNYVRFAIPENRGFEGWELGWVNFFGPNGQTQTDTLRVLSGAVDGHFYAFAQAPDGFTATRGVTVQWDLDAFSSSFVFDGFEMGVTTGYTVTKASCGNGDYYCEVLEDSNGNFSCSAKAGELGGTNSCAWYSSGTVCAPTVPIGDPTTIFPPSPGTSSGTGAAGGNSSSGSLGGFSSFTGTYFNYQFGILPEASGSCAEVFDASGRFKYVKSSTDFSMSLPKRLDFSKERWTCPILSSDLCGVAWDAVDFTVNKVFVASANGISDFVTSPLKGAVAYMGTPKNGGTYCFLGSSVTYGGKPASYVSYLGGKHTESTAGRTAWDWFFIMLLIASMTYYLFRKA